MQRGRTIIHFNFQYHLCPLLISSIHLFIALMPSDAIKPHLMLLSSSQSKTMRPLPAWTTPKHNCCIGIVDTNHLSFRALKTLATNGFLPRRLVSAREPKCAACFLRALQKRPLHSHAQVSHIWPVLSITKPAQCVLVIWRISLKQGFIALLKSCLTRDKYTVITVYVDYFSRLHFVHLQQTQMSAETLDSKNSYKP